METVSEHDLHISNTEIHYKSELEEIQLSTRIYIDDLELDLKEYDADNLYLFTEEEAADADSYLYSYIYDNVSVYINGEKAEFNFIGKEESADLMAVWCYLVIEHVESIEKIEVNNRILTDIYDDQQNIVSFKVDKKRKAHWLFDNSTTSGNTRL